MGSTHFMLTISYIIVVYPVCGSIYISSITVLLTRTVMCNNSQGMCSYVIVILSNSNN